MRVRVVTKSTYMCDQPRIDVDPESIIGGLKMTFQQLSPDMITEEMILRTDGNLADDNRFAESRSL